MNPRGADDPCVPQVSGLHPPVKVDLLPPPPGKLVRRLTPGVGSGADPAALCPPSREIIWPGRFPAPQMSPMAA